MPSHLSYQGIEAIFQHCERLFVQNFKLSYPLSRRQMEYVYRGHTQPMGFPEDKPENSITRTITR